MNKEQGDKSVFMEKYATPVAVILGAAIIAFALIFGTGTNRPTDPKNPTAGTIPNAAELKMEGVPFIGEANAPVTMAVWFDYQCPFCKQFELTTIKQVHEEYVKQGKVKVVFKDLQFLGPDSITAAVFARAVWEAAPEKYYEWHTAFMENQDNENGGFGDQASIEAMTRTIPNLDAERVITLAREKRGEYEKAINASKAEAASLGINSTPIALIGTTLIQGAQPFEVVKQAIETELAK